MAPEHIRQEKDLRKADIWSFGCVLVEILTKKIPWCQYEFEAISQAILKIGNSKEIPFIPENIDLDLKEVI